MFFDYAAFLPDSVDLHSTHVMHTHSLIKCDNKIDYATSHKQLEHLNYFFCHVNGTCMYVLLIFVSILQFSYIKDITFILISKIDDNLQ